MTVRVSDREESSCQYAESAKELAVRMVQIVTNGPKKYLVSYGDHLIRCTQDLYMHCQIANGIYPTRGPNLCNDYEQRRGHLLEARGLVDHVCSTAKIYLDLPIGTLDDLDESDPDYEARRRKIEKLKVKNSNRKQEVGRRCARLAKLLNGVIRSDYDRFRKYNGVKGEARK